MDVIKILEKNLAYERRATAQQIEHDVEVMKEFDRLHEGKQRFWGQLGAGALVLTILSVLAAIFSLENQAIFAGAVAVAAFLAVSAVFCFILRFQYARYNLQDTRYLLLGRLVRLLSVDMPADAEFRARVDFRNHNDKQHFERRGQAGPWKVKYFCNGWLTLEGRLLDGARFSIQFIEKHQDRSRTKRSASGKIKHKQKAKAKGEATLLLKFKPKRYPLFAQRRDDLQNALQLPRGDVKSLETTEDTIKLQVRFAPKSPGKSPDAVAKTREEMMAGMLLSCYHVLNQSRRAAG